MKRHCGSIFVREAEELLETGYVVFGHCHNFHHVTNFTRGTWKCEVWGLIGGRDIRSGKDEDWYCIQTVTIEGGTPGSWLGIEADKRHRFTLLKGPGHYQCIYSHREPETGEVVEEYNGWEPAYG